MDQRRASAVMSSAMKIARTTPATTKPNTISIAESGAINSSWIEFMKRP